jgi:predicted nucleotidyltransferase
MLSICLNNWKGAMIDLTPNELSEIKRVLRAYVPSQRVLAFGSRVSHTARRYSDLDLVLVGDKEIDTQTLDELRAVLAESDLPIHVDVLDWHALSKAFQQVIMRSPVETLQEPDPIPQP